MTTEGNTLALQAMFAELFKKQEETFMTALSNQRQSILEEVRGMVNQNSDPAMGASAPLPASAMPLPTHDNPNFTSSPNPNLDSLQGSEQTAPTEKERKLMDRLESMEKALKAIKRHDDLIDVDTLALFPDARIPPKFKMLEMDKFDGTACPKTHLKMYVGAMKPLGVGNELLAQLFQRTLTGAAMKWFVDLEDSQKRT